MDHLEDRPASHRHLVTEPTSRCRSPGGGLRSQHQSTGRSTKARVSTPATPVESAENHLDPGDRSTKARVSTPATHGWSDVYIRLGIRSTKARVSTPATRATGRPRRPCWMTAQRRPGYQPRRHYRGQAPGAAHHLRSTKARVSTPATPKNSGGPPEGEIRAQRRPGYQPRRHYQAPGAVDLPVERSTKARVSTPATLVARLTEKPEVRIRSTKARVSTPATRAGCASGE